MVLFPDVHSPQNTSPAGVQVFVRYCLRALISNCGSISMSASAAGGIREGRPLATTKILETIEMSRTAPPVYHNAVRVGMPPAVELLP
jgi:hypothetical protein